MLGGMVDRGDAEIVFPIEVGARPKQGLGAVKAGMIDWRILIQLV